MYYALGVYVIRHSDGMYVLNDSDVAHLAWVLQYFTVKTEKSASFHLQSNCYFDTLNTLIHCYSAYICLLYTSDAADE